jgi:hypothetical protein
MFLDSLMMMPIASHRIPDEQCPAGSARSVGIGHSLAIAGSISRGLDRHSWSWIVLMAVEHLVKIGRRSAIQGMAHLILKLCERLQLIGLATPSGFGLSAQPARSCRRPWPQRHSCKPHTQAASRTRSGDALGASTSHPRSKVAARSCGIQQQLSRPGIRAYMRVELWRVVSLLRLSTA